MGIKQIIRFFILLTLLSAPILKANPTFILGNEAYQRKNYDLAIKHYLTSLEAYESPEQHFNLGNAYYKKKEYGKAILHYLKALTQDPNNSEIRANLTLAREAAEIPQPQEHFWALFSHFLSVDTWTYLLILFFWSTVALLLLPRVYKKAQGSFTNPAMLACGIATLICLTALAYYHTRRNLGVVLNNDSPLHIAPTDSSPTNAYLREGILAKVDNKHQGFYFVKTNNNKEGWISKTNYQKIWN